MGRKLTMMAIEHLFNYLHGFGHEFGLLVAL